MYGIIYYGYNNKTVKYDESEGSKDENVIEKFIEMFFSIYNIEK